MVLTQRLPMMGGQGSAARLAIPPGCAPWPGAATRVSCTSAFRNSTLTGLVCVTLGTNTRSGHGAQLVVVLTLRMVAKLCEIIADGVEAATCVRARTVARETTPLWRGWLLDVWWGL